MTRVRLINPEDLSGSALVEQLAAGGNFINLYRAMAHSPPALERFYSLARSLWDGRLSHRTIEVAILSTVAALGASYPLAWHIGDGRGAGLTDDQIRALINGDNAPSLSDEEMNVAGFARQLSLDASVDDALFAALRAHMDDRQIVELTLLVGLYNLIGRVANGLQVELDDDAKRLLDDLGVGL